jgi:peroxiredoxin
MIEEGEEAPIFELPGVRDGEIEQIALSEYLDSEIIILAFYPGDFNPACSDGTTDLDELDLFTMQKDVSILGLSGDSVYSHQAFAEEYDLHIPLLSDAHGDVASRYGVGVDDESVGHLIRRAIVVIKPRGEVEYTWIAADVEELPNVDEVRDVIRNIGGQDTALARYRVGHAHYIEGRRAFTSAMNAYEEKEWMMASGDFDRAYEEFEEAEAEFNTAARFAETEKSRIYFERAERKGESLWRAAEWLGDSANAYASGEGEAAESLRRDAEAPLETARNIHEPPAPDEFPPDEDPADLDDSGVDIGAKSVSLDLDVDEAADESGDEPTGMADIIPAADGTPAAGPEVQEPSDDTGASADTATTPPVDTGATADDRLTRSAGGGAAGEGRTADPDGSAQSDDGDGEDGDEIDEEELEEIAAELEEQTEAAQAESTDDVDDGNVVPNSIDVDAVEDPSPDRASGDGNGDDEDEEIELDLTDPSDVMDDDANGDDDDDAEEFDSGGDHGVPDSL